MAQTELTWAEPPPPTSPPQQKWATRLRPLHDFPGSWARVLSGVSRNSAQAMGKNLRLGRFNGVTKGEFEVAVRQEEW